MKLHTTRRGDGPLLVCHPGGPGFDGSELNDLGGLDATRTLLLVDPRGTGGSDDADTYTLADYVAGATLPAVSTDHAAFAEVLDRFCVTATTNVGVTRNAADRLFALALISTEQQIGDAFLRHDVRDVVAVDHHRRQREV